MNTCFICVAASLEVYKMEAPLHQEVCTKAAVIGKHCLSPSVQMRNCHHKSRYVSWCVDPAESPAPETTALTATATLEESSHRNHQPAASGSVPLLLLSPPETSGGEPNIKVSHQHSQQAFTKGTHHEAYTHYPQFKQHSRSALCNPDIACNNPAHDVKEGRTGGKDDLSLPEDKNFLLPRSSPVISRRHRPVSWHSGDTDTPSSLDSRSPASGLLPLDQRGGLTVTSVEDLGSKPSSCRHSSLLQEDTKSALSHVNHLLSAGLQIPFSGQQGLGDEHRGRGLPSCEAPHSSGLSTSTQNSKDRRCSGMPEFSAEIFKTSCELEKENAHFIVVDMMLEVLEGVKWTLTSDQWTSTTDTRCNTCTHRHTSSAQDTPAHEHKECTHTQTCSAGDPKQETNKTLHENTRFSYIHTHQHTQDEEEEEAGNPEHPPKTFSVLSTDSGFEDCGVDTMLTPRDSLRSAEWLAQQLVLEFRRSWLPSNEPRRGRQSLRSSLQELPGTGDVAVSSSSLAEEIRLRTRMRGSLSWAPPRFQIIFTVQPTHRRSEVVALQHFLCAGCGTEVEPRYIKKLRYCDYLGRYFCDCCHSGSEAVIPGRLLSNWDFGRYPVSDFSKQLLESVWHQPLFDLTCVGKMLYSRVKELDKFRELQDQLIGIKKLLTACRLSGRVMTEFEQLPAHLMEQPHLFSMDDLLRVKKGKLVAQARAVLHSAIDHVENCELCLARGFICEFCKERDIIFPFQRDICRRCPGCQKRHLLMGIEKQNLAMNYKN